jgi:hypothetical protein
VRDESRVARLECEAGRQSPKAVSHAEDQRTRERQDGSNQCSHPAFYPVHPCSPASPPSPPSHPYPPSSSSPVFLRCSGALRETPLCLPQRRQLNIDGQDGQDEDRKRSRESRDSSAKLEDKAQRQVLTQRTREPEKGGMEATNAPILPFILSILSIHVPLLPILHLLLLSFSGALVLCVRRLSVCPSVVN